MPVSKEEILTELRKFVANRGEVPGERTFEAETRIKESSWKGRYWVRWTDAVREAGYDPNSLNVRIPDEELLDKLAEFVSGLDHFPVRDEINMHARTTEGFPVYQTMNKRYGGMLGMVTALLEFAQRNGNEQVAKLCADRIAREEVNPKRLSIKDKASTRPEKGFIYLKYSPSLKLYKIGKANDPSKRGLGISLLLPEDLIPRHEIRTDCPFLLEKYWHHRFKARRRQGEWFDLTASDVEAFKSRREFVFGEYFP